MAPMSFASNRTIHLLVAFGLSGEILHAQTRSCRALFEVVNRSDSLPVALAELSIGSVTTRTDSLGHALAQHLPAGLLQISVRRIGYQPFRGAIESNCGVETGPTIVTLVARQQSLVGVTVLADQRQRFSGPMAGFWERRARGDGTYFTTVDIDRRNVQRLSDLLRSVPSWGRSQQSDRFAEALTRGTAARMGAVPRDPVRSAGTRCFPTVVIDGMAATMAELNTDGIDPRSLAGVEVYVDGARTPTELWGTAGQGRCGVVAVWSRSLENARNTPIDQQAALIDTIYEAHEVDELAALDTSSPFQVLYPREFRRNKIPGIATLSLTVLPTGEPHLRSVRVLNASRPEFGAALSGAVSTLRFVPARRGGIPVTQRAEITVNFGAAAIERNP